MPIEWAISLRYLKSVRGGGALSFITWVSILGVALGVAALVVAMAVMNGYQVNLVRAMAGALPHLSLLNQPSEDSSSRERVEALARGELDIVGIAPFLMDEILIQGSTRENESVHGVMLRGIDLSTEALSPEFLSFLDTGAEDWAERPPAQRQADARALLASLAQPENGDVPVLLSHTLTSKLGVTVGDRLTPLQLPKRGEGFTPQPMARRLVLRGYVDTGIVTFDELVIVADLALVGGLFPQSAKRESLGVRLAQPMQALQAAQRMRDIIQSADVSGWYVYSWMESNSGLFQVIRVQKIMLFLILMLIVVIAFFGMVSALIMLVVEKSKEIAVLNALGLAGKTIYRIFLLQGLTIGVFGTLSGLLAGLSICWFLGAVPIIDIPPGVYPGSDKLPVAVSPWDVLLVVGGSVLICVVATIYPARKAMRMPTIQGLSHR